MKLRIKDNSVRFRITLTELEELQSAGRLERRTRVPNPTGADAEFRYGAVLDPESMESRVEVEAFSIRLVLCRRDFDRLRAPDQEGAYVKREWEDETGRRHRFMAFIEKDRPGSTCAKPEEWIYEERRGGHPETRPIPEQDPPC
jgi:hypothetical protein